jgi:hypothetical protein
MTELELIRTPGDRRRYALEDIGTIHLEGFFARSANADAGSDRWQFVRSGFWQRVMQATDATGNVVGEFRPRDLRRGGALSSGQDASSRFARPAAGASATRWQTATRSSSSSTARAGAAGRSP